METEKEGDKVACPVFFSSQRHAQTSDTLEFRDGPPCLICRTVAVPISTLQHLPFCFLSRPFSRAIKDKPWNTGILNNLLHLLMNDDSAHIFRNTKK